MLFFDRPRIRHPFFPKLAPARAVSARGRSAVLVGAYGELAGAAARGAQARRAVYVLTPEGEWLSDSERDELWRLFQVPIYVLMVKGGASVVAWECEAQNGMHFTEGGDTCACGRPGAKLMLTGT
jgi:hypothetical protein